MILPPLHLTAFDADPKSKMLSTSQGMFDSMTPPTSSELPALGIGNRAQSPRFRWAFWSEREVSFASEVTSRVALGRGPGGTQGSTFYGVVNMEFADGRTAWQAEADR